MSDKPIISQTGEIHGRGSDPFKWVSGLTDAERQAVRDGRVVLVRDDNQHPATTAFKRVMFRHGRYYHRNYYESPYTTMASKDQGSPAFPQTI